MSDTPQDAASSAHSFYSRMYEAYGPSAQGLGWGTKDLQMFRFEALSRVWDFKDRTVLDVGCGLCDLYGYLAPKGIKRYIGIDFVAAYCEYARRRFVDPSVEILHQDLYSSQPLPSCDIALVSGTFNVMNSESEDENYTSIQKMMEGLREACKVGFSINFLSDATTFRDSTLFYANSETILSIARGVSRRLLISHFEFPFEYTLHVWCDDRYDAASSLYSDLWPHR
jgi:SAM-dependent methyltransferase